jgi:hypothetical protein
MSDKANEYMVEVEVRHVYRFVMPATSPDEVVDAYDKCQGQVSEQSDNTCFPDEVLPTVRLMVDMDDGKQYFSVPTQDEDGTIRRVLVPCDDCDYCQLIDELYGGKDELQW